MYLIVNELMSDSEKVTDTFLITKEFKSPAEFAQSIEKQAVRSNSSCLDILMDYCIKKEIEAESISKLLTPSLKAKLHAEASDANLLKEKEAKLPI